MSTALTPENHMVSEVPLAPPALVQPTKKKWYLNRTNQVFIAMILGIAFGHYFPALALELKPIPDIFIRLIKMVITPIVFVTVVCGISQAGDLKKAGVIGLKALIYFEVVTTFAAWAWPTRRQRRSPR